MDGKERLEDVFQDEIVKRFHTTEAFVNFARSIRGLQLSENEVATIQEDLRHSVEEQKMRMLMLWREKKGWSASAEMIRETVENYMQQKVERPVEMTCAHDPVHIHHQGVGKVDGGDGPVTVYNTHITGPIQGPVLMGNETVMLDGAGFQGAGGQPAEVDVPPLKSTKSISSKEKVKMEVGCCVVKFPSQFFNEDTKVDLCYQVAFSTPPSGHVHASSTLSCQPPLVQGRKTMKVSLRTWCKTTSSVDAGIFAKDDEGNWEELDRPILTDEGHIEHHGRALSNVTAFVLQEKLPDIQFDVSCFLYNNADGRFAMGFCLHDQAIENVFLHMLKKEMFVCTIEKLETLMTRLGDEIRFKLTPGQQMQNMKFQIDETFVSSFKGHLSYCKLDKATGSPDYIIEQFRTVEGTLQEVVNHSYQVNGKQASYGGSSGGVEFRGGIQADNFLGKVGNVNIDQRSYSADGSGDNKAKPFWEENKLSYEEKKQNTGSKKYEKKSRGGTGPGVIFHGNVKARNVISSAKNVTIDQRRVRGGGQNRRNQQVEKIVTAEQVDGEKMEDAEGAASEERQEYRQRSEQENKAVPIRDDELNKNRDDDVSKKRTGKEQESSPAELYGKSQPEEIDLRKRRKEKSGENTSNPKKRRQEENHYDGVHALLGVSLVICIAYILYNYFSH